MARSPLRGLARRRTGNSKAHSRSEASRRCTWSRALSRTGPTRNKRSIHDANRTSSRRGKTTNGKPFDRDREVPPFNLARARSPSERPFSIPRSAHVPRRTFPRVAGNPAARSVSRHPPVSADRRYPGGRPALSARWACSGAARGARRGSGMGNDDDNGARRNRSEPNASALGIELTEQASSSGQLTPTLTGRATPRARYRGDEERATAGESASPSRGSRKHQRARQQHQRVGQIIPTYPPCTQRKSEKERERERDGVRGGWEAPRRRRLFPWPRRPTSELFSLSLPLFFSLARIFSSSRSLGHAARS